MKLHTCVNYVVDVFIRIILECVEIMHVVLINISELPVIIKGGIGNALGNTLLSIVMTLVHMW